MRSTTLTHAAPELVCRGIVKRYRQRAVLQQVDFRAGAGAVTGILGPNGAGKSTLIGIIAGLVTADAGSVRVGSNDITGMPLHRLRPLGIGLLPQDSRSFPELTVRDNLSLVLEQVLDDRTRTASEADALLERLGLSACADRRTGLLSGGEQRRLEIAKTLALDTSVIILDEPFAGLDPCIVEDLSRLIRSLAGEQGRTVILTDHQVGVVLGIADDVCVLIGGQVTAQAPPSVVRQHPAVRAHYLGNQENAPCAPA